ncbi:hypothetical protein QCA50_006212 [Cerrena zonata]|uniref:F-box domain-containing protein n=1 Tax=Cerrena zonata TaxID=2478898 RepID=A0AAW0GH74_9APHY
MLFDYNYEFTAQTQVKTVTTTLVFLGHNLSPKSRASSTAPSARQSFPRSLTDAVTAHIRIPSEVCERIIDFCVDHDDAVQYPGISRDTLCNCALTGRSWLPRAQFHLYTKVCIESEDQLRKFSSTVRRNPTLARQVRQLELSGKYSLHTEGAEDFWIYYAAVHLPPLPFLEKITLRYLPPAASRSFMVFTQFRKFTAVRNLWLASPRTLHAGDLGRILSPFPQLTQLSITQANTTFAQPLPLPTPLPQHHKCTQLSSLHLDIPLKAGSSAMSEILEWFSECPILKFTSLSCTQFRAGQHHNALRKLIQRCGHHLRHLNLEWPPVHQDLKPEYIDLQALSRLEWLAISHVKVCDIDRILSIIETLHLLGKKQLTLKLIFSRDAWPLQDSDWDMLNDRLLQPKGVHKIVLVFYAPLDPATTLPTVQTEMVRNIRRNMPNLSVTFRRNLVIQLNLVSTKIKY